jgi:putative ATP-dependent endonuclease of the OLD family
LGKKPEESMVHIISVGGTSFKRYLEVAAHLDIRTVVIRDNDGNHNANCVERYKDYVSANRKVFADTDNLNSTFEICVYSNNSTTCDALFGASRKSLSVQEYMLKNKAEAAFALLEKTPPNDLVLPQYIKEAIEWISA